MTVLFMIFGIISNVKKIQSFKKIHIFSKLIILAALFVVSSDAILHPKSGDRSNPNKHYRPEEYDIVSFRMDDFQAMMGMSFMVFEGIN